MEEGPFKLDWFSKGTLRQRALIITAVLAVFLAVIYFINGSRKRESLSAAGAKLVTAVLNHDAQTIWNYSIERDRTESSLTEQKLRGLLVSFFPKSEGILITDNAMVPVFSDTALSYTVFLQTRDGRSGILEFIIHSTDDGPRAYVVGPIISGAFYLQNSNRYRDMPRQYQIWKSIDDGISRYQSWFGSMSLAGYYSGGPDSKLLTWSYLQSFSKKACAAALQKASKDVAKQ